ncbi:MAG TPA: cytochrome c [Caulobacteraceae bacterium]|jgi:mono/diheme cytochrome c family protein
MRLIMLTVAVLSLAACAGRGETVKPVEPTTKADASPAERGRALVQANCASCHAVAESDTGTAKGAVAFRELHKKYPVEHLQEALGEGMSVGHPGMPEFKMSPQQVQDVIAYLKLLDTPAAKKVR